MAQGILGEIEKLSQLKGINPEIVLEAVKDAMLVAARRHYKSGGNLQSEENLIAEINSESGQIDVFAVKRVTSLVANSATEVSLGLARRVDPGAKIGSEVRFAKPTRQLGRIAAQVAKQVILSKIREAERERVCEEFEDRIGTMEYCTVKRSEGSDLVVDIGGTEAWMPRREQSHLESYMPGDRVRVAIQRVDIAGRGPAVVASRGSTELVKRLFEQEVPEIFDGTVQIMACAREAGERTKIAVASRDRNVDPVGACVGMRGMRVQTIIRELRGEKIDILQYYEDPVDLVREALSPARVTRVELVDPVQRHMEAIVDESQLSLAIGKKGQNVRLASKLLDWRIDIKSEDEKRQEVERALAAMREGGTPVRFLLHYGLSPGLISALEGAGLATLQRLAERTPEQLQEIPSVGPELVERIRIAAEQCFDHLARTAGAVPIGLPSDSRSQPDQEDTQPEEPASTAPPPVLPGEPDAGTTEEVEDDEEVDYDLAELEGFGRMNRYRGPASDIPFPEGGRTGDGAVTDPAAVRGGAAGKSAQEENYDSD